jgi:hypothetical protein
MRQKAVFHGDQPYLYLIIAKKTDFQRLLMADEKCKFGVYWPKMAFFEESASGFNLH